MSTARGTLSPLQAYERAERQKLNVGQRFRARILRLHHTLSTDGPAAARLPPSLTRTATWRAACHLFTVAPPHDSAAIIAAYRDVAMRYGVKHIDPKSPSFARDLREFYRNYLPNFPLPEELTTRAGFRELWRDSPRAGGYQEIGCSVVCPLTGRYLMGVNFTIQPRSDSAHFIYGFVNPTARGLGGFSALLINLMRDIARTAIAAHFARCPTDRAPFHSGQGPLILFEKNDIGEMSLTEILMDAARIHIDRPPRRGTWLASSAISPNIRDLIWDRRGARIIDYNYIQPSLEGITRVPDGARDLVIAHLNGAPLDSTRQRQATDILGKSVAGRLPGCTTLNLCAFVKSGTLSVPAAQIQLANEIFQGISVVRDEAGLPEDIYFQAQMASLAARTRDGQIALKPITPSGPGVGDFRQAEQTMKNLLAGLTWARLREGRDRTYREWLDAHADRLMTPL